MPERICLCLDSCCGATFIHSPLSSGGHHLCPAQVLGRSQRSSGPALRTAAAGRAVRASRWRRSAPDTAQLSHPSAHLCDDWVARPLTSALITCWYGTFRFSSIKKPFWVSLLVRKCCYMSTKAEGPFSDVGRKFHVTDKYDTFKRLDLHNIYFLFMAKWRTENKKIDTTSHVDTKWQSFV